jgi:hypothetical protein
MLDILLSQPGTIFYVVFVLALLFWALWTRQPTRAPESARPEARSKKALGQALDFQKAFDDQLGRSPRVVNPFPPALRDVHKSCSADYDLKFDQLDARIRRYNV